MTMTIRPGETALAALRRGIYDFVLDWACAVNDTAPDDEDPMIDPIVMLSLDSVLNEAVTGFIEKMRSDERWLQLDYTRVPGEMTP